MTSTLIAAALAVATNPPPFAADLPTVLVEASRLDRTPLEIPSAVRVIGPREIAASGVWDFVDLLAKRAPELHLRRLGGGNPALAELSLRGYGENGHGRTLVLVDGERLNSPDLNTPNLSRIALGGVSKIEILGGAQTVLHGDGASAGVINVITEPQDDERKSYAEIHGGSWGAVGAALGSRGGIPEDGIRYWADASWDRADGYRSHSRYDIWNLCAGIRKEWAGGISLRVSGFYGDAQYDLPGALSWDEWQNDPRRSNATEDRFRRATYGVGTTFRAKLNDANEFRLTGSFSNRKMWGYQQGDGWFSDNSYDIYSYRLLAEWINTAEVFGFDNSFVLGVQYATDRLDGRQAGTYAAQRPDYNRQSVDAYAQESFHFTEWLALQLGGRYSRAWAFNSLCEKRARADHLAAFDVALVLNPTEASKVYVRGTRFYRNPFLDEVPGRYDAGYNWVNTTLLAPERGWSAEVGADWEVTDELTLGADAHCSWLADEIFYNAIVGNNENCADGTVRRGVDAHAAWEREKLAGLSLAASWIRATFNGGAFGRNRIPLVPELTVAANGRIWLWDECFLFGGYRLQGDMYTCSDFGNDFAKLSWHGVFHVGATYEPASVAWMEGLKFSVAIDNLLDERYCDYATYGTQFYPAAGRCLTFTVRYEF